MNESKILGMLESIRTIIHGEAWFDDQTSIFIDKLIQLQSSAKRSAYQAIHKHRLSGNDVKIYVKKNYIRGLNQRYIADACQLAIGIKQENSLFGGKRNWEKLQNKSLEKEEWINIRNSQLYSRGDRTKKGNPNIRVFGGKLLVNDPSKRGKWLEGNLFLKEKDLVRTVCFDCYDVRLIRKSRNIFSVIISTSQALLVNDFDSSNGVIGIDSNPDGVAVVETDKSGNLIRHFYEYSYRIRDASTYKRLYDIRQLAIKVVNFAKFVNKPIILEKLKNITKEKSNFHKFNRMRHNFIYRKIIESIKSRAIKELVSVFDVQPAFTSQLGILKYQQMYSLNRHTAAALVIARRGMGISERQTFKVVKTQKIEYKKSNKTDKTIKKVKVLWNLEGRSKTIELSEKSWSWLQDCFLKSKSAILTGSYLVPLIKAQDISVGEIPTGESYLTTGQIGDIWDEDKLFSRETNIQVDERRPSKMGKFFQS